MRVLWEELPRKYLFAESDFQDGHYDKYAVVLREKHKGSTKTIVDKIFSHFNAAKKNHLIIKLSDHLCEYKPGFTDDLSSALHELTGLTKQENTQAALRARQVLMATQEPSYVVRHNHMEKKKILEFLPRTFKKVNCIRDLDLWRIAR